ncbi:pyridoxamine 5'-phosphate oxidase family protein, partial [Terrabacter terrae]|uniref:pyridoxamine 5'-phosphate oxidase family protein n=1 Tax=Terrabacter terrae TaxID=318434 RepID=UPI0031E447F5
HGSRLVNWSELKAAECQALLDSRDVGRIGWNAGTGPMILPVSYTPVNDLLVLRTSPFGLLSELVRLTQVVLEVDELDLTRRTGWSVLVRGRAQAIASPALLNHLWMIQGAQPWAAGTRTIFIGITSEQITGRSFDGL